VRLALLAALLAACSDSAPAVPDAGPDAPPPCSLIGKYQGYDVGGGQHNAVEFRSDGFYVRTQYAGGTATGPYSVSGQSVTLTDQIGEPPSLTCPKPATYTFAFSSDCNMITFMTASDDCLARNVVLAGQTLTRE
jgi:hypothetical protein